MIGQFRRNAEITVLSLVGIAASIPLAEIASAQTPGDTSATVLEEIVVTAEHRESDIQKTAISMSVRDGAQMQSEGRYSLAQILEDIPGVAGGESFTTGQSSGTAIAGGGIAIRGIPSNGGAGTNVTPLAPAAALYVDGVYEGVGRSYDVERVEVLRGPQGTLYGRSATSGVVAVHTADPRLDKLGGNAALEAGNYGLQRYSAALNAPIVSDVLAVRVSGNYYEREGYYHPDGRGAITTTEGRAKVLYKPTDGFSLLVGAALQDNDTGAGGYDINLSAPNTIAYTPNPPTKGTNKFHQYWAEINWDLGFGTLTYEPAYREWESATRILQLLTPPAPQLDQTVSVPESKYHTQELRLASRPDSTLKWQVGSLYYNHKTSSLNQVLDYNNPSNHVYFVNRTNGKETTALGVFGEMTFPFTDSTRLTAGLRYDNTKVAIDQLYTPESYADVSLAPPPGPPFFTTPVSSASVTNHLVDTRKFDNLTYKLRFEQDLNEGSLVYASVSTGFTPGDLTFVTGPTGAAVLSELTDKTLTAYEIGSKNRFLNNRLQLNGAVYYYDYEGYQTAATDSVGGLPVSVPVAAPAQVLGAELELLYQFTENDRAGLNLAYTDARFVDRDSTFFPIGNGTYATFGSYFVNDAIPGAIPFTASLSYDHKFPLPGGSALTFHADARYFSEYEGAAVSRKAYDNGLNPYAIVSSEVIGDLNIGWTSSSQMYSVNAYVRNVADTIYKTGIDIVYQDPPAGPRLAVFPSDPRTYGVVLTAHF